MGAERRAGTSRAAIVQMVVIGLAASAIGIVLALVIHWFPPVASTQADKIDTLWDVLVIVSVPIFVLVTVVVIYAVRLFRMRPGEENLDGPPIHGNTKLEVIWTAIPAALLVSLCTYAYVVLHDIEKAPAANAAEPELKVDVYGEQFAWTFQYKAGGKTFTTTRLYLPVNRSVRFAIHSKDVLHDFWVPAFRMKLDTVPGITGHYRVTPKKVGSYPVVCAELCGLGHAFMRSTVYVLPKAKYAAWLKSQTSPQQAAGGAAGGGAGAPAPDGKAIFTKGTSSGATACGSCHKLSDAGTTGGVGPDLDTALKGKSAAFIKESIVDPNKEITKGYPANVMPPNFGQVLSPQELDAVVQYLVKTTSK